MAFASRSRSLISDTRYLPRLLVLALMLFFTAWFSAYSIRLHDAHLTHKADLGQIDLAIWNTSRARFLQEIKGETISTRLTDHVEPIFLPVSLVFWIWDDARALLVLQAAALAAGAWPIYLLARRKMGYWVSGIVFAAAYLLTPALQAASVADFHALPLAAPLIAWALWAIEDRRWLEFTVAAVLLAGVQEGMALLAAALGLYATARTLTERSRGFSRFLAWETDRLKAQGTSTLALATGVAVTVLSLVWFYVATFVIIPHYAFQAYGLSQTPYAARFGELGDSFGDVLKALLFRPDVVLRIIVEPLRLRYLAGLLWPTAFLALLGPEILLLSLPLLLANLLSAFPFQYSGELHYSAPLVPYFVTASVVGMGRLIRQSELLRKGVRLNWGMVSGRSLVLTAVVVCALGYQVAAGYLPIGLEFWRRIPGGWPQVTAHHRLLDRFAAQIPRDAALSVATDLYPHLSHRELVYQFPTLGQATWALVDITGTTDRHPNDVRSALLGMLDRGWGVVDAADGYLLLAKGQGQATIPDAFYAFARSSTVELQHPLDITFGGRLKLLGYDVLDDAKWRRTSLRFYWQVIEPLPADTTISVQVLTPDGSVADDTAQRPMPALVWYPPARWKVGETIVTQTLPWYLPRDWAPVITVAGHVPSASQARPGSAGRAGAPAQSPKGAQSPTEGTWIAPHGRLRLSAWTRRNGQLIPLVAPEMPIQVDACFSAQGWSARLTGWAAVFAVAPGKSLPVMLRWQAAGPAPKDYTVFLHLRDASGRTAATGDATPTWFLPLPTSTWPVGAFTTWDAHAIAIPASLPEGRYDLVAGWYDWETGDRLQAAGEEGNVSGNEFVLGPVTVHRAAGPRPDLACLLAAESCASLE